MTDRALRQALRARVVDAVEVIANKSQTPSRAFTDQRLGLRLTQALVRATSVPSELTSAEDSKAIERVMRLVLSDAKLRLSNDLESQTEGTPELPQADDSHDLAAATLSLLSNLIAPARNATTELSEQSDAVCARVGVVQELVRSVLGLSMMGSIPSEQRFLSSPSINAAAHRTSSSQNNSVSVSHSVSSSSSTSSSAVRFSFPALHSTDADSLDATLASYSSLSHCTARSSAALASTIVTAEVLDSDGAAREVSDLPPSQSIRMLWTGDAGSEVQEALAAGASLQCSFWDTRSLQWSQTGCQTTAITNGGGLYEVNCECSHLTDFALLLTDTNALTPAEWLTALKTYYTFAVIYCALSLVALTQAARYASSSVLPPSSFQRTTD